MIIRNDQPTSITISGVIFAPGEQRDLSELLSPTEVYDATIFPLNKSLADGLDDGDVTAPNANTTPPMTPGDIARPSSVEYVIEATQDGGAYNFRGNVANIVDLAGILNPQDGDHVAVQATGTLFEYENAAWVDTGINASFQDWIPPVGPNPTPINQGAITPDLTYSVNVAFQPSVGVVYRTGNTNSGYNYAGFASENVISQAGDFFEFPSVRINNIQGFGLASTDTLEGNGPNQNGVPTPGVFCNPPSNFFAYSGRDVMGYLKTNGLYTTGAQNGGALIMSNPSQAERDESGVWSTGGRVRVGLDAQYHFYIAMFMPTGQVWQTLFRSTTPMPTQDYRFVWVGFYAGSVLSQLPNQVVTPPPPGGYSDLFYTNLDGFNEYIDIGTQPSLANVLNYGQPWAFGFKISTRWNVLNVATPRYTVLKNGGNTIYLNAQSTPGGNTAPYLTAGSAKGGANTWAQVNAGDNILFQSSGTSIQFYINGVQEWIGTIPAAVAAGNAPSGQLTIGEAGPIGAYLQGGIDNVWFMGRPLIGAEVSEAGIGGDPQSWSFYAELLGYYLLGEGGPPAFPNSVDFTGQLPDAVLINGEDTDFTPY